jgi:DIM1 family U5 snRNP protein
MGSAVLTHLQSGWHVDQAIVCPHSLRIVKLLSSLQLNEDTRVVVMRFGRDSDPDCIAMDEHLYKIVDKVKKFASIYLVDNKDVPDFNVMYELYDPCTIMFFWR